MEKSSEKTTYYDKQPNLIKSEPSKLREHFSRGMTAFLVIVGAIIFFFVLLRFTELSGILGTIIGVLKPIIYGFAIAFLLNPIMTKVEKWTKPLLEKFLKKEKLIDNTARTIGVFAALVFAIALISALLNMLIPELYNSIRNLVVTLPGEISDAIAELNAMADSDNTTVQKIWQNVLLQGSQMLENWVKNDLVATTDTLITNVTTGVISVVNGVVNLLVGIMAAIYILFSKEKFLGQAKKIVYATLKPKRANLLIHIARKANSIFTGFIIGKIIDSAIIGVLCFIGISLLKMPYVLLVSVIVGVTNVIPVFGPYIGAVPSAILILLVDPIKGLYFIIFIILLQQLDGNVIGPTILGDSTGLSPFWVLTSIVVGGGLFGVLGMILGVPTFALFYYIFKMIVNQKLEQKELPTETVCYTDTSYVDDDGKYVSSENKVMEEK